MQDIMMRHHLKGKRKQQMEGKLEDTGST